MLIQRSSNGDGVLLTLVGRIETDDIPELQRVLSLEPAGRGIALDLRQVTLAGREAVMFLGASEAQGIKLEYCPSYIREWIDAERGGTGR